MKALHPDHMYIGGNGKYKFTYDDDRVYAYFCVTTNIIKASLGKDKDELVMTEHI